MKPTTFDHSRDGLPDIGGGETHAFARERYEDFLREAEQFRLEHILSAGHHPDRHLGKSLLVHLLVWAGILRTG